ncbi:MAG: cyclic peptide export ABC transporter, partial [Bacteroidota bacterium]
RKEIISLVLNANYQQLAKRKLEVHSAILHDVYVLTDASMNIISFFTSLILGVSCLIYLATISLLLFAITLGVALLGAVVYTINSKKTNLGFQKYRKLENKFLGNLTDILEGFKEITVDPKKGRYIFDNKITPIAEESYSNNKDAFTRSLGNQVTGQVLFYMLISSVLLYFSIVLKIKASDIVSFVFTLLYLLGAIEAVMVLLPGLFRAKIASDTMLTLRKGLEEVVSGHSLPGKYISKNDFEQISVIELKYYYGDQGNSFGIGPISLDVKKGETIFIYGGNGSGKTTLIHSILGLCVPSAGEIRLNNIPVDSGNSPEYRTLFSVVFSDFHLFSELLAIDNPDMEKWNYYLRLFELEEKIKLENNSFSTTDLSTGQRKRLALIIALLEEKPVLVIDEWAADQDPHFRKKFYTEILPLLKEDDITVIAITHDDKYYYCADKIFKMEYGLLSEENVVTHEASFLS